MLGTLLSGRAHLRHMGSAAAGEERLSVRLCTRARVPHYGATCAYFLLVERLQEACGLHSN